MAGITAASVSAPGSIVLTNYLGDVGLLDGTDDILAAGIPLVGCASALLSLVKYLTGMTVGVSQAVIQSISEALKAGAKFCKPFFVAHSEIDCAVGGIELAQLEQAVPPMIIGAAVIDLSLKIGQLLAGRVSSSQFADDLIKSISQHGGALAAGAIAKVAVGTATGVLVCLLHQFLSYALSAANFARDRRHNSWRLVRSAGGDCVH